VAEDEVDSWDNLV